MIILIVMVFDPLALTLVLAAQSSYRWLDDDLRNRKKEEDSKESEDVPTTKLSQDDVNKFNYGVGEVPQSEPIPDAVELEPILEEVKEEDEFLDENLNEMLHETAYDDPKEDENVSEPIQPNDIPTDDVVREDVPETPTPDAVPTGSSVAQSETRERSREEPAAVIKTEGVTLQESDGGYVKFDGKSISRNALREMRPDLFLQVDLGNQPSTNFGIDFPKFAKKGDTFVRVDTLPNRVFKFSGDNWIEINKNTASSYLYDEEYIAYLVSKIESGEYDVDLLSDAEKEQIEEYLVNRKSLS
jgi:hypothetical protein